MKKLLALITLFALTLTSSYGIVQTFVIHTNATIYTNVLSRGARIFAITLTAPNASATDLAYTIYDGPMTNFARGWFSNGVRYAAHWTLSGYYSNITKTYTNFSGWIYTNTFTNAWISYSNQVVANTNMWDTLFTGTVASNGGSVAMVLPTEGIYVSFGLGLKISDSTSATAANWPTMTVHWEPEW